MCDLERLIDLAIRKDKMAIGKLLTLIENNIYFSSEIFKRLWSKYPRSHVIGVTGPGGVGKSTLISSLAKSLLAKRKQIAIITIDPRSPVSGGSLLGDRIRMRGLNNDVFIRSMSTPAEESLPVKSLLAIELLEAIGYDYIIIETPGAGQFSVRIMKAVDTVVVVFMPGMGDEIQALKAGLTEVGHIYVVNKADLPGADLTRSEIEFVIGKKIINGWKPRVVKTIALSLSGISELLQVMEERERFLNEELEYQVKMRQARRELEVQLLLLGTLKEELKRLLKENTEVQKSLTKAIEGNINPVEISKRIALRILKLNR